MDKQLFLYPMFEPHKNIIAFSTTKQTFLHPAPRFTGDSPDVFTENRKKLANVLGINANQLVFPRQTHTNCVVEIYETPENEIKETDALLTNQPGICLCVQTADCVPILLFDPVEKVIAAVHAGWRGTVKRITEVAVQKMITKFGTSVGNILAVIGPSISPDVYEVGNEVVEEALKNIPQAEETLHKNKFGKFHFNLWEANRQILMNCGVNSKNIEIAGECSFTKTEKYFSARRDGADTGRMVSGIMMNN
jgi:YfiH family protein